MEKNIILAQIGKTPAYKTVKYKKLYRNHESDPSAYCLAESDTEENIECTESCYSFDVILSELEKKKQRKADVLILAGTKESSWANLCRFFGTKYAETEAYSHIKDRMQEEEDASGGIQNILEIRHEIEAFLTACLNGTNVRILIQNNGITYMESKENFNLLSGMLSEVLDSEKEEGRKEKIENIKINLHLDISNGFRSFPMYVFLSSNYIRQIRPKEESIRIFMYYGMFDKKLKLEDGKFVSSCQGDYVPYVDMSDASDIMQWTDAVAEFYNSGSVIQLLKILDSDTERGWADIRIDDGQHTVCDVFRKFHYAVNTNNLKLLGETTRLLAQMERYLDDSLPDYAKNLLEHISKDFQERFQISGENRSAYGTLSIQTAIWYLDQQRTGDAVIALQEGMITYAMETFSSKCEALINKKLSAEKEISQGMLAKDEALFDFKYRETVREYVFDTRDIEEKEWLYEYKYLSEHLRDPAMRMQYNITDKSAIETDMNEAEQAVRKLAEKILAGKLDPYIEKWLDELLNMQEYDFFICYRRTSWKKEDGVKVVRGIADFLSGQGYDVFWDMDGHLEGAAGEYRPEIRNAIRNSRYVILLLGKDSLKKYTKNDCYYMEIQTAAERNNKKRIFSIMLEGFEDKPDLESFPDTLKEEIKKIVDGYQHIGFDRKWGYSEKEQNDMHRALLNAIWENQKKKQKK